MDHIITSEVWPLHWTFHEELELDSATKNGWQHSPFSFICSNSQFMEQDRDSLSFSYIKDLDWKKILCIVIFSNTRILILNPEVPF